MTDAKRQALNERIALKRDWEPPATDRYEYYRYGHWKHDWRHESSDGGYVYSCDGPPDFTREWNHAGPLFEEMVKALGYYDSTDRIEEGYINRWGIGLTEAIALAYDAWKE